MKIQDNREAKAQTQLSELDPGQVFSCHGRLYLALERSAVATRVVLDLETYCRRADLLNIAVEPVDALLVIGPQVVESPEKETACQCNHAHSKPGHCHRCSGKVIDRYGYCEGCDCYTCPACGAAHDTYQMKCHKCSWDSDTSVLDD